MGNIGPMYLAWSFLRHKGLGLAGPLLVLVVCILLLFTMVGLYLMPQDAVGGRPANPAAHDSSSPEGENETGKSRDSKVRMVGFLGVALVVVLLFRYVLEAEIANHLREFHMLHTVGYSRGYMASVVYSEMLLLILLAFFPAVLLAPGVDLLVRAWTGWPISLSLLRFGLVLLLSLLIGFVAACFPIRRWRTCEPAMLFP